MMKNKLKIKNKEGMDTTTPDIIIAALNRDAKLVGTLLTSGEDINTIEPQKGFTCLHIGCMQGDDKLVSVLLKHHEQNGEMDFGIKTFDPPRLAWQLAMNFHHYDLARKVDNAAPKGVGGKVSPEPKLIR